jgi:hypothetical protein
VSRSRATGTPVAPRAITFDDSNLAGRYRKLTLVTNDADNHMEYILVIAILANGGYMG